MPASSTPTMCLPRRCCRSCARILRSPAALWCRTILTASCTISALGCSTTIQPLDLNDNTGEQNSLCDAIGFFNPVWDSKEDQDACFFKAVAVAKQILEHQIESANAVNRADEKVQQAYQNSRDGIVVLPCYLPWKNGLYKTDALFVVYPSQRGGWSAQCVTDHKTKKPKLPFPQSWGGQPQEVIEQKSGIPGISFCHASRFLITAKDKETALAACRQVLKNNGRV